MASRRYPCKPFLAVDGILGRMRRIQMDIDEKLDEAVTDEAARRGISKGELIRACLARELAGAAPDDYPWGALIGRRDDDPIDDIDEVVYGPAK